jgi:hypothetical protein
MNFMQVTSIARIEKSRTVRCADNVGLMLGKGMHTRIVFVENGHSEDREAVGLRGFEMEGAFPG